MATTDTTDKRSWRRFKRDLLGTAITIVVLLYGFVVLVAPLDNLALSLPLMQVPIDQNQRFSYPVLARSARFDSVVIGTSTTRLLRPMRLDDGLDARFVNLSMNSATAYEQVRLLELFVRHNPAPRYLLIGIDAVWCNIGAPLPRYTFREFPEWLYDDNPWNDYLHLLNGKLLEQSIRLVQYSLGRRGPRYGLDGYRDFLPGSDEYDLRRVRERLYGSGGKRQRQSPATPLHISDSERSAWTMPGVNLLERSLATILPETTQVLLFFVPYHLFSQPRLDTRAGVRWQECKQRVARLARERGNIRVADFMIPSSITREDANYWDPLHFTTDTSARLEAILVALMRDSRYRDEAFEWLYPR